MMFRLVNRLLSFLQHIHNHRFYVFSVYTICLFYEIFFFSSHNFFYYGRLKKKPYADTLFCLTVCIYVYVRPFYVMRILRIFLWHILFPYFPFIVIFFSLLLTFSPYFVSFASYSCMFVHFIILHVLEHSYALIL